MESLCLDRDDGPCGMDRSPRVALAPPDASAVGLLRGKLDSGQVMSSKENSGRMLALNEPPQLKSPEILGHR